jgi:hypothetical protein
MDMTKFEDIGDPGLVSVAGELRRWIKEIGGAAKPGRAEPRTRSSERGPLNEEAGADRQVFSITQGGSEYNGPTTVNGGSVFQGNFVGREGAFPH